MAHQLCLITPTNIRSKTYVFQTNHFKTSVSHSLINTLSSYYTNRHLSNKLNTIIIGEKLIILTPFQTPIVFLLQKKQKKLGRGDS
jgi:hypothetical protein